MTLIYLLLINLMFGIFRNVISNPRKYLIPTYRLPSILEIEDAHLENIKYIIFDKDDTLTLLKSNEVLPRFQHKLSLLSSSKNCLIVSNGKNNPE